MKHVKQNNLGIGLLHEMISCLQIALLRMHRAVNAVRLESYVMVFPFEVCFIRLALSHNIFETFKSKSVY